MIDAIVIMQFSCSDIKSIVYDYAGNRCIVIIPPLNGRLGFNFTARCAIF
jgi:hypothetical protein